MSGILRLKQGIRISKNTPYRHCQTTLAKDQKSFLRTLADIATKTIIICKLPDKQAETAATAFHKVAGSQGQDQNSI